MKIWERSIPDRGTCNGLGVATFWGFHRGTRRSVWLGHSKLESEWMGKAAER